MNAPRPTFATIPGLKRKTDAAAILEAANQQAMENGVLTIVPPPEEVPLPPAAVQSVEAEPAKATPLRRAKSERKYTNADKRLAVEIPTYLVKAVQKDAFEHGCTARFTIIQALHKAGFKVEPEDLVEDRRRA